MRSLVEQLRGLALAIARQALSLRLPQTAASLAFLSMLALVPVISIALSVLTVLPMFERLRDALQKFLAANLFLPSLSETVMRYINQFASQANELSLLGALVFFATAFSALLTIERTLNQIWDVQRPRPLTRRITLYWTLLTLGPLLLAASVWMNGFVFSDWFTGSEVRQVRRVWFTVLPWVTTAVGLCLLYRLVPNAAVRWREAWLAALVATVLLEVLKYLLGRSISNLPTYTVVYGAFAAVPLFLVWLFMLWMIVLLGALLAANLRHWGAGRRVHLPWSPAENFAALSRVLLALAKNALHGSGLVRADQFRVLFDHDGLRAERAASVLANLGYVHRHWQLAADGGSPESDRYVWEETWALADAPQRLTLRALFEAVWNRRRETELAGPADGYSRYKLKLAREGLPHPFEIDAPLLDMALDGLLEDNVLREAPPAPTVQAAGIAIDRNT